MNPEDIGENAIDRGQDTELQKKVRQEQTILKLRKNTVKKV